MNRQGSATGFSAIEALSALVFALFAFAYIYCFQSDLLTMTQYAWSGGRTHYHPLIGFVIILLTLTCITLVVNALLRFPKPLRALVYFPAYLLMGLLTSGQLSGPSVVISTSTLLFTLGLAMLYGVVVIALAKNQLPAQQGERGGVLSLSGWVNGLLLLLMMSMTVSLGNTDRTLHTRLRTDHFCQQGRWAEALAVGGDLHECDSSLTMLRAMALANTGQLGERLFSYRHIGGARSLLPTADGSVRFLTGPNLRLWSTVGRVPRNFHEAPQAFLQRELRRGTARKPAADYLLSACLLDRDLREFARLLPRYYTISDSLPTHYQEAYVLAADVLHHTDTLRNESLHADYADFLSVRRSVAKHQVPATQLQQQYFGSYWYYYHESR